MRLISALAFFALSFPAAAQEAQDPFTICLGAVTSRFIGETEKNLGRVFERAEQRDVALSFDEADALFGGRTHVREGHDRYDEAPVDRLIARIERFAHVERLAGNTRRALVAGFDRRARGAGLVVIETEGGAHVIELARADRRRALDYAREALRECPPEDERARVR